MRRMQASPMSTTFSKANAIFYQNEIDPLELFDSKDAPASLAQRLVQSIPECRLRSWWLTSPAPMSEDHTRRWKVLVVWLNCMSVLKDSGFMLAESQGQTVK